MVAERKILIKNFLRSRAPSKRQLATIRIAGRDIGYILVEERLAYQGCMVANLVPMNTTARL